MVRTFVSKRFNELLYVGLSLGAAGLNYLVYPVILRLLETHSASSSISILNLSSQLGGVFTISTILAMYASTLPRGSKSYLIQSQRYLNILFALSLVAFILSSSELKSIISGSSLLTFAGVALLSYISVIAGGWMGTLNAQRKFLISGGFLLSTSLIQLLLSVFTVKYLFPSVNGLVLSFLTGYFLPFLALSIYIKLHVEKEDKSKESNNQTIRKSVVLSFLVYLALWYAQSFELYISYKLSGPSKDNYIASTIYPKTLFFVSFIFIWTVVPRIIKYSFIPLSQVKRITLQLASLLTALTIVFVLATPLLDTLINGHQLGIDRVDFIAMLVFKSMFSILSLYYVVMLSRGNYMRLIIPTLILAATMSLLLIIDLAFALSLAVASLFVLFISVYIAYNMVNEKQQE